MNWIHVCEWLGAFLGLLGAYMLATHSRFSKWGWVAFLASNVAMIGFALGAGAYGLLLMQFGFMGSSSLGCYRAGLWPLKRSVKETAA